MTDCWYSERRALNLLRFFPEIQQLLISKILDLHGEGYFFGRGKTIGHSLLLAAYPKEETAS